MRRATIQAVRPDARGLPPAGVPGTILGGKYRLEEAIARGGMARVWRTTHITLNRPVAVKFVESWGTGEERIERFLREAKVAASVRHRHVVDILDFGTIRDEPYMVMELLEGETLDQRLVRGPIENDEFVEIATQILSGLDAVHRVGIVHRDLKPGNVFLTTDEVDGMFARLLDFGISQDADEVATAERVVVGTPEYMSPEQAFGDPLDARSDIYSVGVVLYEMLSGVLPFEHSDPQEVVELVAHGTPMPIIELRPDVPEMCAVVERAMARHPDARFSSAREMRRAVLDASGRGPETTGGFAAIPRDSRTSGMQARAIPTTSAEIAIRSEPPPEVPLPPRGGRAAIGIAIVALVVASGAIAWALAAESGGTVDPAATVPPPILPGATVPAAAVAEPAEEVEATDTTSPTSAAPDAPAVAGVGEGTPEEAPRGESGTEAELGAGEEAIGDAEAAPDSTLRRRGGRARPRRGESSSPSIVRELDF